MVVATALGRQGSSEWSSSGGHPYLIAWPAIMLAAWLGGCGPGLLATALSVVEICSSVSPFGSFRLRHPGDLLAAVTFGACGAVVTLLIEWLHVVRRREERWRHAREEILAIVAHDLRAPLQSILLAVASVRRGSDAARCLDRIEKSGRSIERLIRDLLDATVLDRGAGLPVALSEEDVEPLVAEAVEAAGDAAARKSISILADVPSELPRLRCDRSRMLQVLANLLGNATKFTPTAGRIAVRVAVTDGSVRFEVSDSGPGIAAEEQTHVFERHWSRGATGDGVGLGLYIAEGIVRAHGGRLWLRSEVGKGASFFMTVPLA